MKKLKWIIPTVLFVILLLLIFMFWKDTQNPYQKNTFSIKDCDYSVPDNTIPKFKEVSILFKHQFNEKHSLPVMGSCLIDINNDGIDEVFFGGGNNQNDALFQYKNEEFLDISSKLPNKNGNTLSGISYDFDQNGFSDIIVTRDSTVSVLLNNNGIFTSKDIKVHLNNKTTPLSLTLGDFNKDGFIDMFIAGYIKKELMQGQTIFNDKNYGGSSVLLLNKGDNSFKNITLNAGINYIHNTFQAVFVDVNKDNLLDLVVAYDTGEPRIYLNKGNLKFELKKNPLSDTFSYPMGIAIGDYDNNGTPDIFFSNIGSTIPEIMAKGDLNKNQKLISDWILLKNDGKANFKDVAKQTKLADFEFSWGAIFEDFNLDGRQDLVVAENYIAFPPEKLFKLPCRFLTQQKDGTFSAVEKQAGVINKNYAITPLSSDFNNDGFPDLIYTNLNGKPKAFISNNTTLKAGYLKVRIADKAKYIGATVTVKTTKNTQTNFNIIGEGLCSDQSNTLIFGIGNLQQIVSLQIKDNNGNIQTIKNPKINTTIKIE